MKRLVVNDARNQLGEHTFWDDLCEWLDAEFVGGDYSTLAEFASLRNEASLIVRNGTFFPPITAACPQIALVQDIAITGPVRDMQSAVLKGAKSVVYNSAYTASHYAAFPGTVIPLPVDFGIFEPQNAMGCQQALSLPDGCVCWIGASQGAAGQVKGYDILLQIVRTNPDIPFVGVFKDAAPDYPPPNMRCYERLTHAELVKVIGACRIGLCTSRMESQHLAGIEMGGCGLPIVAPPVGVYWNRTDFPGGICKPEHTPCADAIRAAMKLGISADEVHAYWRSAFDKPVIRAQWTKLIEEVECSGR